jgi:ERCC4-type nuclease
MKKFLATILIVNGLIWFGLTSIAKANDYNTAVIGHIITQKIQGNNVDTSVLEAEIHKLTYKFALEMTSVLEKHLPNILESIASELRSKADSEYKCQLLKNSKIKDKECI